MVQKHASTQKFAAVLSLQCIFNVIRVAPVVKHLTKCKILLDTFPSPHCASVGEAAPDFPHHKIQPLSASTRAPRGM